jgi:hypothetical protein
MPDNVTGPLADGGIHNQTSILISQEDCDETRN